MLRLFVGLYPPPGVVQQVAGILDGLDLPPYRATRTEQVHLTLYFIGDIPAAPSHHLESVIESVKRSSSGLSRFTLNPEELIALPHGGAVRLLALRTDAPAELLELHSRLVRRLAERPRRNPSDRYHPHLTLCRFRSPQANPDLREMCQSIPFRVDSFPVESVFLMQSHLHPDGAIHREVMHTDLH